MDFSRQKEVFDNKRATLPVHIIGCGATGSWVAMSLARLGVNNINLYDFDVIEEHNLPNQAFPISAVGKNKAEALMEEMRKVNSEITIKAHNKKVEGNETFAGTMFVLVDSMKARKEIFRNAVKFKPTVDVMIETRMDAFIGYVYTIKPQDFPALVAYDKTLYSDDTATVSMCGIAQSLAPTASILANVAVWQYIKHIMGEGLVPHEIMLDMKFMSFISNDWR